MWMSDLVLNCLAGGSPRGLLSALGRLGFDMVVCGPEQWDGFDDTVVQLGFRDLFVHVEQPPKVS